ncbi:MAG: hypothetical protein ABFD57_09690 [Smithella sp.]
MSYYKDKNMKLHYLDDEKDEYLLPHELNCVRITNDEAKAIQISLSGKIKPFWNGTDFIETALVFQGIEVNSKADVDNITRQRIVALGEEKAKTEKLIAGSGECPIWDAFILARASICQDGDVFIAANNLI